MEDYMEFEAKYMDVSCTFKIYSDGNCTVKVQNRWYEETPLELITENNELINRNGGRSKIIFEFVEFAINTIENFCEQV